MKNSPHKGKKLKEVTYVRDLQRNRRQKPYIPNLKGKINVFLLDYGMTEIYVRDLAHMILEPGKCGACRADHSRLETGSSWYCGLKSEGNLKEEFLTLLGTTVFSLKDFTYWVRPTHIMEGNLLYLKYTNLNANCI